MDVPKLLFNPPTEHIYVYPTKWGKETHLANCLKGWDNVSCREDKLNGFGMIWGKDATKMQIYNMPLVKYVISSYYLPAPCFLSRSLDFNQFLLQPVGLTSTLIRPWKTTGCQGTMLVCRQRFQKKKVLLVLLVFNDFFKRYLKKKLHLETKAKPSVLRLAIKRPPTWRCRWPEEAPRKGDFSGVTLCH